MTATALLAAVAIVGVWAANYHLFYRVVYGGPPAVPCHDLPLVEPVQVTLEQQSDVVQAIEAVNPDHMDVGMDTWRCPGRADIHITYDTARSRRAIQNIIGHDSLFFGVPYRMSNI